MTAFKDLTLTTNGYLLAQQAQALKDAGLQRVTVSLDSLDDDIFGEMNGRGYGVERVLEGIEKAREVGLDPIKVNAVVQKGVNDHTLLDLLRHFKGTGVIVRFIEYMDVGNLNGWKLDQVVPSAELVQTINQELPIEPVDKNYRGEVADRYRYHRRKRRDRVHFVGDGGLLQRLHPGAALHRRQAVHLPLCQRRPRPERADERRRDGRRA